jgi:hypothetical protein
MRCEPWQSEHVGADFEPDFNTVWCMLLENIRSCEPWHFPQVDAISDFGIFFTVCPPWWQLSQPVLFLA